MNTHDNNSEMSKQQLKQNNNKAEQKETDNKKQQEGEATLPGETWIRGSTSCSRPKHDEILASQAWQLKPNLLGLRMTTPKQELAQPLSQQHRCALQVCACARMHSSVQVRALH